MSDRRALLKFAFSSSFAGDKSFANFSRTINIKEFGAKCDGSSDDYAAIQMAIDFAHRKGINNVTGCSGTSLVSKPILLRNNIVFNLNGLHLKAMNTGRDQWGSFNASSVFMLGYWSPAHNGFRRIGATSDFDRKVSFSECLEPVSKTDKTVKLKDSAWKSKFLVGEIYYIRSREIYIQRSTGIEIEIPIESSLVKIISISNGAIEFEEPIGFDTATPPLIGAINVGATENGFSIYFVQNVEIFGGAITGRVAFGSNNTGAYKCLMHDFKCDVVNVIQANGLAFCRIFNFHGNFAGRAVETKFCAHDSQIYNFLLTDSAGSSSPGMFSIGEGSKNIEVSDFKIDAKYFSGTGAHLFQLQYGNNCIFKRGHVFAPSLTSAAIVFYADNGKSVKNCIMSDLLVIYGSRVCIIFSNGMTPPEFNRIENCRFIGINPLNHIAIAFNGGKENSVINNIFRSPMKVIGSALSLNFFSKNRTENFL